MICYSISKRKGWVRRMKRKKQVFLLHTILVIGGGFLLLLTFYILPSVGESIRYYNPEYSFAYKPAILWVRGFMLPIFASLYPLWKIFSSLRVKGGAFTGKNVSYLKAISYFAIADALIFPLGMLILGSMGASQPALTYVITPFVSFVCFAVAVMVGVLASLLEEAVKLKEENDLTI